MPNPASAEQAHGLERCLEVPLLRDCGRDNALSGSWQDPERSSRTLQCRFKGRRALTLLLALTPNELNPLSWVGQV
jgi:hypothetical protein